MRRIVKGDDVWEQVFNWPWGGSIGRVRGVVGVRTWAGGCEFSQAVKTLCLNVYRITNTIFYK